MAIYSTNKANKAGGTCRIAVYIFLDVYGIEGVDRRGKKLILLLRLVNKSESRFLSKETNRKKEQNEIESS